MLSKRESESEMEALLEALAEANQQNTELSDQLADTTKRLEEEKKETAWLAEELAHVSVESGSVVEAENRKSKDELQAAKERYRKMWRLTCKQSHEQEELFVVQQEEINRLKQHATALIRAPTPTRSLALSHGNCDSTTSERTHDDNPKQKSSRRSYPKQKWRATDRLIHWRGSRGAN